MGARGGWEVEEVAEDWEAWGSWGQGVGVLVTGKESFGEEEDEDEDEEGDGEGCEGRWKGCYGLVVGQGESVSGSVLVLFSSTPSFSYFLFLREALWRVATC